MASKKLEKGSDEWQLFTDFWNFRQQYYEADNNDEWFVELMNAGEKIIEKYHNTELAKFAQDMVFAHFSDVELREKKIRGAQ